LASQYDTRSNTNSQTPEEEEEDELFPDFPGLAVPKTNDPDVGFILDQIMTYLSLLVGKLRDRTEECNRLSKECARLQQYTNTVSLLSGGRPSSLTLPSHPSSGGLIPAEIQVKSELPSLLDSGGLITETQQSLVTSSNTISASTGTPSTSESSKSVIEKVSYKDDEIRNFLKSQVWNARGMLVIRKVIKTDLQKLLFRDLFMSKTNTVTSLSRKPRAGGSGNEANNLDWLYSMKKVGDEEHWENLVATF